MKRTRSRIKIFLFLLAAIMVAGTAGFTLIEGFTPANAFYFTIVTIATVGYGDIHPATLAGKILAIGLIITGVGTFLGVIAEATEMMISRRDQQTRLEKLNMIIGVFFSEVGTKLLVYFSNCDPALDDIRKDLIVTNDWDDEDFNRVEKQLRTYRYSVDIDKIDLAALHGFLEEKTGVLLRLLENPNLLEHESFTELLRADFHFKEELGSRADFTQLPDTDLAHLAGDIKRSYTQLVEQWLDYMKYLKDNYPYLFSLAMRTNPFDTVASPIVHS